MGRSVGMVRTFHSEAKGLHGIFARGGDRLKRH